MFLLMAGVDTTGYIVNWLMINLAANPGPQELLRDELSAVLKGGDLESQHLESLPYLKACIRESHRLTPPGPIAMARPTARQHSARTRGIDRAVCLITPFFHHCAV